MKNLDIIIPVKNEEKNIQILLERVAKALNKAKISYKIIFIDDHSTDKTLKIIDSFKEKFPIKVFSKKGTPGKAFSIIEGATYSVSEYIVMLDADLQYPPEAIPEMFEKASEFGVVVANRKNYRASLPRRIVSRMFNFTFGRVLHGFKVDVQSGLKLFKREIIEFIEEKDISPWTLDLNLLHTARNLGHKIGSIDIDFDKRSGGQSKVSLLKTSAEIGKNALVVKLKNKKTYLLKPVTSGTMAGAGFVHNRKWFKTHTTLKPQNSALEAFQPGQYVFLTLCLGFLAAGLFLNTIFTLISIVAVLSFIYSADVLFNLYVVLKSLHYPPELTSTDAEIAKLKDENLPVYTILCPLYREAHIIPYFLEAIEKLNYPKDKLDVKLLLEEDDTHSIEEVKKIKLPKYVSTVVVPDSQPKTKPKACNYGLNFAIGEYLVVYDAEDQPEPDQLKKAYLAFKKSKPNIVCLQAKLNYFNPHQNLLTRFFTAEYSLWFDVMLTGLQSIDTVIPLGGTSNHFRTKTLIELEGWDPFNVTEDCDLGVRLFKRGYKTAIIDSITLEEANSSPKNWLRQRSRWIKGYMQTYLVHMRNPYKFAKEFGWHSLIFQLIIGARITFMLINPILWLTTFAYFAFYIQTSAFIESLYPTIVFYFAVFSLIAGNFLYIYNYMIGSAKRSQWGLMKYVFLIPVYWLMASVAAGIALYQLIVKPHYWEKTIHGLHLDKTVKEAVQTAEIEAAEVITASSNIPEISFPNLSFPRAAKFIKSKAIYWSGLLLVGAYFISNISNFILSTYLGRQLSFEDFGLISLFSGFMFIFSVPIDALGSAISQKTAYILGKHSKEIAKGYLNNFTNSAIFSSLIVTTLWIVSIPYISKLFQSDSIIPFLIYTPVWSLGIYSTLIKGYLKGTLSFGKYGGFILVDSFARLLFSVLIVSFGYKNFVYASVPLALFSAFLYSFMITMNDKKEVLPKEENKFDWSFFFVSVISNISTIAYLSLDLILVKLYLNPVEAGKYGLLALVGKMIFFLGSIFTTFMIPIVSKNEGAKQDSSKVFMFLFGVTALLVVGSVIALGGFGFILVPILLGSKAISIIEYLPVYALAIGLLTLAQPIILYYQAKKDYSYTVVSFIASLAQIALLSLYHENLKQVAFVILEVGLINLTALTALYCIKKVAKVVISNSQDFIELFFSKYIHKKSQRRKILIFNWRDTKHVWAGGAEAYIFELAKRFVERGYQVTIFCGNDGKNKRYEVMSGVDIFRRGGFYTVYIWAALYYIFKFRKTYDLVIDSANGIPFFTPFFVTKPKFLLIHHIHQEVFREHLKFPFSTIASFIESKLMPLAYRNQTIITVSDSSKKDLFEKIGLSETKSVSVINPGINISNFSKMRKTSYPSFLYLGRIQKYKNIDVVIKAFKKIHIEFPEAVLTIAGFGGEIKNLKKLAEDLNISESVKFLGRVTEAQKSEYLAKNWVMLQPSSAEGWGITVIEANASATTVIASNVNGLKDSVLDKETGLLAQMGDEDSFADAMRTLIVDKALRVQLSEKALKWSKNFDWEKSAEKFFNLIDEKITHSQKKRLFGRLNLAKGN